MAMASSTTRPSPARTTRPRCGGSTRPAPRCASSPTRHTKGVCRGRTSLDEVNRALQAREVVQLVPGPDGCRLDHRHVGDPVDDALANLAEPIVREVTGGRPDRLRACADDGCRWVFYDDSRTGRRRWCDMASCGNRAKAARHRARVKGSPTA